MLVLQAFFVLLFEPDGSNVLYFLQAVPSERWCDKLCIMVCICLSYHGADADAGLVLAPVPLRWLEVSPRGLCNVPRWDHLNSFHEIIPMCCSLRKTWACGRNQSGREQMAYEVIRDEYLRLGPMSYAEMNVLALFVLMVVLWFTRDPRFMDGWATHLFNSKAEWVQNNWKLVKLQKCVFPNCV